MIASVFTPMQRLHLCPVHFLIGRLF